METTNFIVDYLIIGISCIIWIAPLWLLFVPSQWTSALVNVGFAMVPFLIGLLYIIGIASNRLSDDLTQFLNQRLLRKTFGDNAEDCFYKQLNTIICKSSTASDYLSYRRNIVRVARAAGFNSLLGVLTWSASTAVQWGNSDFATMSLAITVGLGIICILLFRAFLTTLRGYFKTMKGLYSLLVETSEGRDDEGK